MGIQPNPVNSSRFKMFLFKLFSLVILAGIHVESASIGKRSADESYEYDVLEVFDGVKDVKVMLEKRFNETNSAVVQIAKTLEEKFEEVLGLTDTFKDQQITITNTYAKMYDMTKRMKIVRVKLYALAGATIRNSDRLNRYLNKFKNGGLLGKDYKRCLTLVNRLLSMPDRMLTEAEEEIEKVSGEMSETLANIVVFKRIVEQATREAERREREGDTSSTNDIIMESGNIVMDIHTNMDMYVGDLVYGVMRALPKFIKLGTLINKVASEENFSEKFTKILEDLKELAAKVKAESENMEKERKVLEKRKNIVQNIRAHWLGEYDNIEVDNIELDDVDDIIDDVNILRGAAQNYINNLDELFPN